MGRGVRSVKSASRPVVGVHTLCPVVGVHTRGYFPHLRLIVMHVDDRAFMLLVLARVPRLRLRACWAIHISESIQGT